MKKILTHIDEDLKFRLGIWLKKAANTSSAAFCGLFVAAGLLSFAGNGGTFNGRGDIIRALLLAVFSITVVCGIFSRPRLMPKAFFALFLAMGALLCPPAAAWMVMVLLCPVMILPLYFGARWRGARFAILPLILAVLFVMNAPPVPPKRSEPIPLSLYLPSALLYERPDGAMLIFGEPDPAAEDVLKRISFRSGWVRVDSPQVTPGIVTRQNKFPIAIAGSVSRFDGIALRRGVYRWLIGQLAPDGVLVMPIGETPLLPPGDWRISVMPGCDGRWVAARRGKAVCVDPELLDDRIKAFSAPPDRPPVLPAGAFSAICLPAPEREVTMPPRQSRWFADPWNWIRVAAAAAVWAVLRLLLCRRVKIGTAAAAAETTAAMMLYTLAIFPKWSANMMDTGLSPFALFAGIGLLLLPRPFYIVRNGVRIFLEAAVGILPWLPGCNWCWLPVIGWFFWFLAGSAVFTGIRSGNRRSVLIGALTGAVLGVILYMLLGGGSSLPVCIAVLLLIPSWLRR